MSQGNEYSYMQGHKGSSGVFVCDPQTAVGFKYRETIDMGTADVPPATPEAILVMHTTHTYKVCV